MDVPFTMHKFGIGWVSTAETAASEQGVILGPCN